MGENHPVNPAKHQNGRVRRTWIARLLFRGDSARLVRQLDEQWSTWSGFSDLVEGGAVIRRLGLKELAS